MKILFTADLHLNIPARHIRTGRTAWDDFEIYVTQENPDAVVVAGDIGSPVTAGKHIEALRKAAGDRPLATMCRRVKSRAGSLARSKISSVPSIPWSMCWFTTTATCVSRIGCSPDSKPARRSTWNRISRPGSSGCCGSPDKLDASAGCGDDQVSPIERCQGSARAGPEWKTKWSTRR